MSKRCPKPLPTAVRPTNRVQIKVSEVVRTPAHLQEKRDHVSVRSCGLRVELSFGSLLLLRRMWEWRSTNICQTLVSLLRCRARTTDGMRWLSRMPARAPVTVLCCQTVRTYPTRHRDALLLVCMDRARSSILTPSSGAMRSGAGVHGMRP